MKKLIALLLAAILILSLCACGKTPVETPQNNDPAVETPTVNQEPTQEQPPEQTTEPVEIQPTDPEKTPFELACECIDKTVQELYELVGEPQSADYAPSCLNPGVGEDGNLYYKGFIVYTYREGDKETVSYVEETK